MSRKHLKNIAGGLVGSFVSRNNDAGGSWALGRMYALAQRWGDLHLRIDLGPALHVELAPVLKTVISRYSEMLDRLLASAGTTRDTVAEAFIDVQFEAESPYRPYSRHVVSGEVVSCKVTLVDQQGRVFSQQSLTVCEPRPVPADFC